MFVRYPFDISQKQSSLALRLGVVGFGFWAWYSVSAGLLLLFRMVGIPPRSFERPRSSARASNKKVKAKQNGEARNDEIGLQDLSLHREK
jgi:hypothetical protein